MMTLYKMDKAARISAFIIVLFALFSLCGCLLRPGNNNNQENTPDVPQTQTSDVEDHTASGSGSFFSALNKPEHSPENQAPSETPEESAAELNREEKKLVGQWSSHHYGEINGQSTSDDELITFMKNGAFADIVVTSGPIMDGVLRIEGHFKADGDTICFYDCTESWEPSDKSADEAHENEPIDDYESNYEFLDDQTFSMSYMTYEKVD